MKVKVLSAPGKASALPGVLSLGIKSPDTHAVINCLPDSVKILNDKSEIPRSRHLILNDICPLNTSGFKELAEFIDHSEEAPTILCPPSLSKWTKALLFEQNYQSKKLTRLQINSSNSELLLESMFFRIRKIGSSSEFCTNILQVESESPLHIFFIELGSINADIPELLNQADIVFINLSGFPSRISEDKLFNEKFMQQAVAQKLAAHGIRTALLPSSSGIIILKPSDDPSFRKTMKECKIKSASVEFTVIHENSFETLKNTSSPLISISPDKGHGEFLLGFDATASLCARKKSSPLTNPPSFPVLSGCSYRTAAVAIDFRRQTERNQAPLHFCTCALMKQAIDLMDQAVKGASGKSLSYIQTIAIQENATQKLLGEYTLELEATDKNGTVHMIKLRELKSSDSLIYAPDQDSLLKGRPQFLNGVNMLLLHSESPDLERLKKIQETFKIAKMLILSRSGTHMYDLEKA